MRFSCVVVIVSISSAVDQSLGKELYFNLLYRSSAARGARVQEQYKPRPAGKTEGSRPSAREPDGRTRYPSLSELNSRRSAYVAFDLQNARRERCCDCLTEPGKHCLTCRPGSTPDEFARNDSTGKVST